MIRDTYVALSPSCLIRIYWCGVGLLRVVRCWSVFTASCKGGFYCCSIVPGFPPFYRVMFTVPVTFRCRLTRYLNFSCSHAFAWPLPGGPGCGGRCAAVTFWLQVSWCRRHRPSLIQRFLCVFCCALCYVSSLSSVHVVSMYASVCCTGSFTVWTLVLLSANIHHPA